MWKELFYQMLLLSCKLKWNLTISFFVCPTFGTLTVPNAGQDPEQRNLLLWVTKRTVSLMLSLDTNYIHTTRSSNSSPSCWYKGLKNIPTRTCTLVPIVKLLRLMKMGLQAKWGVTDCSIYFWKDMSCQAMNRHEETCEGK